MLVTHMHVCMLPSLELYLCTALLTDSTSLMQCGRHDAYMSLGWGLGDDVYQEGVERAD